MKGDRTATCRSSLDDTRFVPTRRFVLHLCVGQAQGVSSPSRFDLPSCLVGSPLAYQSLHSPNTGPGLPLLSHQSSLAVSPTLSQRWSRSCTRHSPPSPQEAPLPPSPRDRPEKRLTTHLNSIASRAPRDLDALQRPLTQRRGGIQPSLFAHQHYYNKISSSYSEARAADLVKSRIMVDFFSSTNNTADASAKPSQRFPVKTPTATFPILSLTCWKASRRALSRVTCITTLSTTACLFPCATLR